MSYGLDNIHVADMLRQGASTEDRTSKILLSEAYPDRIQPPPAEQGAEQARIPDSIEEVKALMKEGEKGIQRFATGDYLYTHGDRQILFTPSGDRLTIEANGSYDLRSGNDVRVASKGGAILIEYPNGDCVRFDKKGLLSIQRGNDAVLFRSNSPKPGDKH
jgi:hypothetical protein